MDASHFVYGGVLGVLWTAIRMLVPTGSGRQRLNVLGAIAYRTLQFHSVVNVGSVATEQVCELMRKLRAAHRKPISIVLDNARYQKNKAVMELATALNIELVYLPAYSPNLNLIERVWKFVKAEALSARVLPEFTSFRNSIESTLSQLATKHRAKMKSLITRNFQLFDNAQVLA
jgi:transposase